MTLSELAALPSPQLQAELSRMPKSKLIDMLDGMQHFRPPRIWRQDKTTLVYAAIKAIKSGRY